MVGFKCDSPSRLRCDFCFCLYLFCVCVCVCAPLRWGEAREVRQGAHGGDFKEEIIPCTGLGPGRVIGKRGATVMRLQDETGARIEVRPEDGQCFVSGTTEQVAAAAEAVRRIIEEGDGYTPVQDMRRGDGYDDDGNGGGGGERRGGGGEFIEEIIPCAGGAAIGRIIGKQGATIMGIEEETGARLQVDQRLLECVISGYPEEVEAAARRVRQVMVEGSGGSVVRIPCTGSEGLIIGPRGSRVRRMAGYHGGSIHPPQRLRPLDTSVFRLFRFIPHDQTSEGI